MPYSPAVRQVLDRINEVTPVNVEDYDDTGEWFQLESDELWDQELYANLNSNWYRIVGPYLNFFALIYCQEGDDPGVWLHYLATSDVQGEYLSGCYLIPSWV
jgi:hypothetical protein